MSKNRVTVFKVAATYIGTVVGAGFATGQEIFQFFAKFGFWGFIGLVLTTTLLIGFAYLVMEQGSKLHAHSHFEIIMHTCGSFLGSILDIVITFFLFGALTVMIAGTGALFAQQFHLPSMLGNLVMAAFTAITVLSDIDGVINSISCVVPFLLVAVIGTSIYAMIKMPPVCSTVPILDGSGLITNWFMAAILYVSYNIILSIAVLGPLGAKVQDERVIRKGAFWGGLGLGTGALMIYFAILGNLDAISKVELPMIFIAGGISAFAQIVYAVVLTAEIYTTAVGSLYGFVSRITVKQKPSVKILAVFCATAAAFLASQLGFSTLVSYLYPIIGYSGLVLLLGLVYINVKRIY